MLLKRTSRDNQTSIRRWVRAPGRALGIGLGDTGPSWVASQRLWAARRPGSRRGTRGAGAGARGSRGPRGRRPPGRGRGASGLSLGAAPGPARPGPVARLGQAGLLALGAAAAWGARVGSAAGTLSSRQVAASGQSRPGPRGRPEGRGRRDPRRCAGVRGRARPEGTECDDKVTGLRSSYHTLTGLLCDWQPDSGRRRRLSAEGTRQLRSPTVTGLCDRQGEGVSASRWGWEDGIWQGDRVWAEGTPAEKSHSDRTVWLTA